MPQPNEPAVQQYFDTIIKSLEDGPSITCGFAGSDKGKAIYADRDFKAGESVWGERPFVAMQHEDNKDFADCCEHCFVSLINSKDAWERIAAANEGENDAATFDDFQATIDLLQKQGGKTDEETYFSVYTLAKNKVQCVCGVLYCSEACRKAAYDEQHAILCPRTDDLSTPMGKFVGHTLVTNEIFQLAGKVIARVLSRYISTHDLAYARQPVDMFCKMPWWDVVVHEADLDEGETIEQQHEVFKGLVEQTFNQFVTGLRDNLERLEKNDELNGMSADALLSACAELLTVDFFGQIVGMFEMNNISMEIDHPFHTLTEALDEALTDDKKDVPSVFVKVKNALGVYAAKYQHAMCDQDHDDEDGHAHDHSHAHAHDHGHDHSHDHHHDHDHGEDIDECCGEDDEDFVGVEGTALFPTICTMNHSCDPNCTVIYMKDGTALVYALHDIKKGEELCISYIDVDQTVDEREECLREYQFKCFCARCEEERNA